MREVNRVPLPDDRKKIYIRKGMRSGRTQLQLHGGRPASCNKFSRLSPYPTKGRTNFQKAGLDKYLAGYFNKISVSPTLRKTFAIYI